MKRKSLISLMAAVLVMSLLITSCSQKKPGSQSSGNYSQGLSSSPSEWSDGTSSTDSSQGSDSSSGGKNSSKNNSGSSKTPSSVTHSSKPPVIIPDVTEQKDSEDDIFSIKSTVFTPSADSAGNYNIIDKLDKNYSSKLSDASFITNSQFSNAPGYTNFLKASKANGCVIYQFDDLLEFNIDVIAQVLNENDIKIYLSSDGKNYNRVTNSLEKTGSVSGMYNKYLIKNKFVLSKNAKFLKIVFENPQDKYISEIRANIYSENINIASTKVEYSVSSNISKSSDGYKITDNKAASIIYYRENLKSVRLKVKYKGAAPTVTIGASSNETYFKDYQCVSSAPADVNGFKEAYYYPNTTFYNGQTFEKIQIQKSDNNGSSLYITEVTFCENAFTDGMNNTELMYGYSNGLQAVSAAGKKYYQPAGSGYITYNINDINGIVFDVRFSGSGPDITLKSSSDGQNFTEIPYSLLNFKKQSGYTYGTIVNKNVMGSNINFIKVEFGSTTSVGKFQIQGVNDPVAQFKKILSRNNKTFNNLFSVSHIANGYQHTTKDIIREGVDNVVEMGGDIIDLYLNMSKYKDDYKFNTDWKSVGTISTVTDLAKTKYFKYAFDNPNIKTYILYLDTGYQPNWKNGTGDLVRDYNATYDLAKYLYTQYNGTGKTFIFRTWEADWWLVDKYPPAAGQDQTYSDNAFQNFTTWINNRQDAVTKARQDFDKSSDVNVYNALMFVNGDIALQGKRCVLNNIVPNTYCDLYAFSAYSTAISEFSFEESLKYIKNKCPDNSLFGNNNVFIGEMGIPEQNFGVSRSYNNLMKTFKIAANNNMRYINYWQMYCNEPKNSGDKHTNANYNGYWLIRADGTKPPIYHFFRQMLK